MFSFDKERPCSWAIGREFFLAALKDRMGILLLIVLRELKEKD